MKKISAFIVGCFLLAGTAFSQVMQDAGFENNVYTGFGKPLYGDPVYYGFTETFQARLDVNRFTLEGMLNWGIIANWSLDDNGNLDNYTFKNTPRSALGYLYGYYDDPACKYSVKVIGSDGNAYTAEKIMETKKSYIDNAVADPDIREELYKKYGVSTYSFNVNNGYKRGQTLSDDYYVNFIWHPAKIKGFDFGAGTKLNWQVGPAPRFGSWLWEADSHVRQGGFSTYYDDRHGSVGEYQFIPDSPGSADVVGFVPYANKYAKKAVGIRWQNKFDNGVRMEIGGAIPDRTNTDNFRSNFGLSLGFDKFALAFAYEGMFQKYGNFYSGASFGVNSFSFDIYGAWDGISKDSEDSMSFSTGAAMTVKFEKPGITIRPEGTINWFENENYTPAWYVGGLFQWDISKIFTLSAWSSFAVGSKDKRWNDYYIYNNFLESQSWGTGHIVDFRPEISASFNKRHTLSAYFDIENRVSFDEHSRTCWSTGAYWTYKLKMNKTTAGTKK